jgi:hypothetical protein
VQDFKIECRRARMPRELCLNRASVPDEQQSDLEVTRSNEGAVNNRARPIVAAHRIDGDSHQSFQLPATSVQAYQPADADLRIRALRSIPKDREAGSRELETDLCLFNRTNLAAFVVTAVGADLVRRFRLAALRTGANRHGRQRIVGAPLRCARFGMAAFGIRHDYFSFSRFNNAFSGASLGSTHFGSHSQFARFKLAPHSGQSPRHDSAHNGFIGKAS